MTPTTKRATPRPFPHGSQGTARHFRRLYILALGLIAGLAIVGQVLVQRSLINQASGSHVVNEAGFQRMLSQRIALKIEVYDEAQPDARAQIHAIESLRDRWIRAHAELVDDVDAIGFDRSARTALTGLLTDVKQPLMRMSALVDRLAYEGSLTETERRSVLTNQEIFLPLMDAVVSGFDQSMRARVDFLERIELGLLALTLLVLGMEAVFIFRPAVRRLAVSLEQLEMRNRQSGRRLESLRHLAGGIAHSFNNLLTGIMGHAELQRYDAAAAGQSTEFIDAQIEGCKRAADIVAQLLRYSGYGHFALQPTSLGPWLEELAKTFTPDGSTAAVDVEIVENVVAGVDPTALAQAIEGIVANAVESMTGRAGTVTVKLLQASLSEPRMMSGPYQTELPPGLYACIRVIDHGEGIAPEELEGIFDPYHTRKQFGRGLGLAAVLGIAHGHGGGIEVESKLDRGSTVSLYVPMLENEADRETSSLAPAPAPDSH